MYWLAFILELVIVLGVIMLGIAFAAMMNPVKMASASPNLRLEVGLLDLSESSNKDLILSAMREKNIGLLTARDKESLKRALREGDLMGGLILPEGYDEFSMKPLEVQLIVDGSKPYASVVAARMEEVVKEVSGELSRRRLPSLGIVAGAGLSLETKSLGRSRLPISSPDFVEAMYLMVIPLVMVFPILLSANMTSDSIVGEKERGTLGILMATPVSTLEIILGKLLPILALTNLQFVAWILLLERNVMGSVRVFNKMPLLLFLNLGAICFTGASLLISTRARTTKESNLYLTLLIMACIFPLFVFPSGGGRALEGLMLVRVVGYMSASPHAPPSAYLLSLVSLASLAALIIFACLRSLGGLEPPPSK